MRPFLLIQTRSHDDVVADELSSTARLGGFAADQLVSLRLDRLLDGHRDAGTARCAAGASAGAGAGAARLDGDDARCDAALERRPLDWSAVLDRHAGVILGGSPFNSTDPEDSKTPLQLRVEEELRRMLDEVTVRDHPFLGACYGVGTLGLHQGAVVDDVYAEQAGPVEITLTDDGARDPLLRGMPRSFQAFVGHKEAIHRLPDHAVVLASGAACPVQMFRVGRNMYATQFHPELDLDSLLYRLRIYSDQGYFDPERAEETFDAARAAVVDQPSRVLRNFRALYDS
ncbi:glutamine amidotransferase [Rothia sp. AR01]|uniref:Glutamine amidotransferase n=1 Tax=Rothia santali TaxID=2949643 RepID=A0A9X2HAJ7_9MICC|nr:glutamine amidotransferase [Rothia santali]MCP3424635.1 glutamine amidotransferase [Rothia santali]